MQAQAQAPSSPALFFFFRFSWPLLPLLHSLSFPCVARACVTCRPCLRLPASRGSTPHSPHLTPLPLPAQAASRTRTRPRRRQVRPPAPPKTGPPAPSLGPPAPSLGPPAPSLGPPAPSLGPPAPSIGPPARDPPASGSALRGPVQHGCWLAGQASTPWLLLTRAWCWRRGLPGLGWAGLPGLGWAGLGDSKPDDGRALREARPG